MKTGKIILSISIFIFVFFSCEKEIDIKLNSSEPRLVIEAFIVKDSLATVRITKSKNYGESNEYPPVDNAFITLSDNNGNIEVLEQNADGEYKTSLMRGIEGTKYSLTVNVEGDEYTAESTMPIQVNIGYISMYYIPAFEAAAPMVTFLDPEGIENYYRYVLYINGKKMPDLFVSSDEDRDGKVVSRLLFFDSDYNDEEEIKKGDLISVEMYTLDKGAYDFFESWARIGSTLANPKTNITGGALGYFSAHTMVEDSTIADW